MRMSSRECGKVGRSEEKPVRFFAINGFSKPEGKMLQDGDETSIAVWVGVLGSHKETGTKLPSGNAHAL